MNLIAAVNPRALRIVLPGGSGLLGQILARHFQQRGHHVTVLTRGPYTAPWQTVHWDGEHPGPWTEYLEGADVCINLAGRSVNCRYDEANREAIYDSRIQTTRLLDQVIAGLAEPPRVWLNASTATIYRHALDRPMDEATGELGGNEFISKRRRAPETWNFSIRVAKDWELRSFRPDTPRTRKVAMRSAIVFSPAPGSAFASVLKSGARSASAARRATAASSSPGFTKPTSPAPSNSSSPATTSRSRQHRRAQPAAQP